jgi:cytochrome o ubiquinol oxidase operon protein cyoD
MSTMEVQSADPRHVHGHNEPLGHADHHHDDEAPHGSLREYLTGFFLSVLLTAVPFWLVMGNVLPSKIATVAIILTFAVVQMLVHMVYFLHLNTRSEGGWNMLAIIFTLVLVVITIAGSLWVMFNMNEKMMPAAHEMRIAP